MKAEAQKRLVVPTPDEIRERIEQRRREVADLKRLLHLSIAAQKAQRAVKVHDCVEVQYVA